MKTNLYTFLAGLLLVLTITACEEDDFSFGDVVAPDGLTVQAFLEGVDGANPNGDGSGMVTFVAQANNAITYKFVFGDGLEAVSSTGTMEHRYLRTGLNTYLVTVIASGRGGVSTSTTTEITVFSSFDDPQTAMFLTGGSSKTWYWSASEPGHLGVGPNAADNPERTFPSFYAAVPFEKDGAEESLCLYMDELTFRMGNDGNIYYTLDNKGQTYFNFAFESVAGGSAGFDFCYDFDASGEKIVSLGPADSFVPESESVGTTINIADGGFMSYYIGTSSYEIMSINESRMVVRGIAGNDDFLAWYQTFTTTPPAEQGASDSLEVTYENLVFSDEFDSNGAPDPTFWTYDTGTGTDGWGNQEVQFYTDRADNVVVEDGLLKITAKREAFGGRDFTSARIKTQDLFDFTYGRVDVRAKIPEGGGTWPAIWMLGSDFPTVGWPACGEIDIMEHVGNNLNVVLSTLHSPSSFGASINKGEEIVPDATTEFHVYSVNWSPDQIAFLIDDEIFYIYDPEVKDQDTWPFDNDFFIILNLAMGGTFGGTVDPAFSEATFEIDYVRVYQ